MFIRIDCIYFNNTVKLKKYTRTLDQSSLISYIDIANKMSRNDVYSYAPSEITLNFMIQEALDELLDHKIQHLFFVLSSLREETLFNLKSYIEEKGFSVDLHAIVDEESRFLVPSIYFNSISVVSNVV